MRHGVGPIGRVLALVVAAVLLASLVPGPVGALLAEAQKAAAVEVPQKARDVRARIEARHGEPPPGYVGGRRFENRERRLPVGVYREYDVNPRTPGENRGPERIVVEQRTGKAYYSPDHYRTFVRMD